MENQNGVANEQPQLVSLTVDTSRAMGVLYGALAKAQGAMENAKKDSTMAVTNTTKKPYADLASCWDAARKPLSDNGFCVIQIPSITERGVMLKTILGHASGQDITSELTMRPSKDDIHGVGSCITYARRYAFCPIVGIAPEDDDGDGAMDSFDNPRPQTQTKAPPPQEKKPDVRFDPAQMIEAFQEFNFTLKDAEALCEKSVKDFNQHDRTVLLEHYTKLSKEKKAALKGEVA